MDSTKLCECGCGGILPVPDRPSHQTRFLHGHVARGLKLRPPRQPLQGLAPEERFWHHVEKADGCWLWTGTRRNNGGGCFYGIFHIYAGPKDKNGQQRYAHRFSWELHFGAIPDGLQVCHHCDNPPCVRPDHLFLGTAADNNHDMRAKGRHHSTKGISINRGEKNPHASLNIGRVYEIRRLYYANALSQRRIASRLGVTAGAVQSVIEGRTWRWLPNEDGTPFVPCSRQNTPRGEENYRSTLTADQIKQIRRRYAAGGIGAMRLGKQFGVTKGCVQAIIHRRTWKHVLDD